MLDTREAKLAEILTGYSVKINKGDIIQVDCGIEAKNLSLEICRLILMKGALPRVDVQLPGFAYTYYKYATEDQLKQFPKIRMFEAENTAGSISIGCEYNTRELTNIAPQKISMRSTAIKPISEVELKKDNWVICEYPTAALAQDADMSLEEYEYFVFNACLIDWKKLSKEEDKLKEWFDKSNQVRLIGEGTDLNLSIKGRQGIKCCGKRNMPDGEVFIAPVETDVNGHVTFSFPGIHGGREVEGVYLEFKDGKVIRAKATKNEDFLHKMLDTDEGARRLGEWAIGLNYGIKQFTKQILFDEKIGGTVHMALGMAYKEGGGVNDSAIHWDMIKDLRKKGEIWFDNKCIQKDGKFLINIDADFSLK